jgi:BirA family transcriptional regulator, biotin operon repressor / biotin---[acetyl-CoA-carboxylase] ligase
VSGLRLVNGGAEMETAEPHGEERVVERRAVGRFLVETLAEVDSTNRYLADRARRGAPGFSVASARRQLRGRGRLGRQWIAPEGASLAASLLLRPPLALDELHLVPLALALAAEAAIERLSGGLVDLKWPNDLLVGGRKLAGILAEAVPGLPRGQSATSALVVGIGINCHWPEGFGASAEEAALLSSATTCRELGLETTPDALLDEVLVEFASAYDLLVGTDGARQTLVQYRRRCATLQREVEVTDASGTWRGRALDLDRSGRLVVERQGREVVLDAGDVVHLRAG